MSMHISKPRLPFFADDPFEQMVAIVMAIVAIVIGVLALLDTDVSVESAKATIQSQRYLVQAMGTHATGLVETGFAWADGYRQWLALDNQVVQAEASNPELAEYYRTVRDRTAELTPLLQEPYFNPETDNSPNIAAFEASTYLVERTALEQQFQKWVSIANQLGDKSEAYNAQLLLLTVAEFLFGLAIAIRKRVRWIFVGGAAVAVIGALIWAIITYTTPLSILSNETIDLYARGVGLVYQGDVSGGIASFDEALSERPDYAIVYFNRANAHYRLGNYDNAVADYQASLDNGNENVTVPWNMGWTNYIRGDFNAAIADTETALTMQPTQVALIFNLAIMKLASGDLEGAQTLYDQGIEEVAKQVSDAQSAGAEPSASLWYYMGVATQDIDSLLMCVATEETCDNSPSFSSINTSEAMQNTGRAIRIRLKNTTVALEYTGQRPADSVASVVDNVDFATAVYDDQRNIIDFEPLNSPGTSLRFGLAQEETGQSIDTNLTRTSAEDAKDVFIRFSYDNLEGGQLFVVKTYKDNIESQGLRLVEEWQSEASTGEAALPLTPGGQFSLASGEYRVEIYVDGNLIQESSFEIEE